MMGLAPEDDTPRDFTSQITEKLKLAYTCTSGSFGVVHQCTIETSEGTTEVAVKVFKIDPGRAIEKNEKAMRRELMVWLRLKHRTIVPLLGIAFVESPFPALISQWMSSGTLYVYFKEATILTISAKVGLAKGVADGLQYLHSENVVHGDLHPANVLIDCSGNPRLTDFGLATVVGDAELQLSITTATRSLDPRWRAPEVIGIDRDPGRPTFTSDVYSFGGIMFFVFSGDVPWKEKKQSHQICIELSKRTNLARPDNILDIHWDLIQECWSWDPENRPKAMEVFESIRVTGLAIEECYNTRLSDQSNSHSNPSTSQRRSEPRGFLLPSSSRSSPYALPPLSRERTYDRDDRPFLSQSTTFMVHSPGRDWQLRHAARTDLETYHDSQQQQPVSLSLFNAPAATYWNPYDPESKTSYPRPLYPGYRGRSSTRSSSSSSISSLRDSPGMPSPALSNRSISPPTSLPQKRRRSSPNGDSFSGDSSDQMHDIRPTIPPKSDSEEWEKYACFTLDGTTRKWLCTWSTESGGQCKYMSKKQLVKRHVETTHLRYKPFVCSVCGKGFPQKTSLDTHMHGHTGSTPHACRYNCGMWFKNPARRHRHMVDEHQYVPRRSMKKRTSGQPGDGGRTEMNTTLTSQGYTPLYGTNGASTSDFESV